LSFSFLSDFFHIAQDKNYRISKETRYIAKNTIVDKTVIKKKKAKGKKQETGNKEHIVEKALCTVHMSYTSLCCGHKKLCVKLA